MKHALIHDFETASACDLKAAGAWRYAEDITTEILCLVFQLDDGEPVLWLPDGSTPGAAALLRKLAADPDVIFVAHNAGFEKAIWRRIMVPGFGFPLVPNSRYDDTMAAAAMRVLPQQLEKVLQVLRLPHQKDMEGSRLTRAMSKPNKKGYYDRDPEKLSRVFEYCRQDIRGEVGLYRRLAAGPGLGLPAGEKSVWLIDQRINERGVKLDLDFIRAAQSIVDKTTPRLEAEFGEITGGLKTTQALKVKDWVLGQGVTIPNLTKETLDELLGSDDEDDDGNETDLGTDELPAGVCRALSIRRIIGSASIKKLARMEACVCGDGRARGLLQYHGAGPGRWAGRLLQPQNFPRGTIKLGKEPPPVDLVVAAIMTGDRAYVEMLLGPPVEVVVGAIRHALVASPERQFVSGDFAGIEARIVLALAGQHDKTALMASGADVYCDMASQIYKRPIDKKKDPAERQIGKNSVLGLGFQMGAKKFWLRYAKEQPFEFAQNVVDTYRKEWAPCVPQVWYGLESASVRTVHDRTPHESYGVLYQLEDGWLTARLPSGRKLWYFNPQPTMKSMPWDADDIRPSFSYQAMKTGKWTTIDSFGGLMTENVVQALARDIMVAAMFKCEANNLPIVLTVHDEILAEPLESQSDAQTMLTQIMEDSPAWAKEMQVPVSVETWTGARYKK